jgi:nucleotide-binding universal stress UspA family protein
MYRAARAEPKAATISSPDRDHVRAAEPAQWKDGWRCTMWNRLLLALDESESGQVALEFATELARATTVNVWVLHLRELSRHTKVLPLHTPADSQFLVDEAVFSLRLAGIGADGTSCSVPEDLVPRRIANEAASRRCDAIILGSRRLRGFARISGQGVRERVLRVCALPVLVAPTPAVNGLHSPAHLRANGSGGPDGLLPPSTRYRI